MKPHSPHHSFQYCIAFYMLLCSLMAMGQTEVVLYGTVSDTTATPLPFTNLIAQTPSLTTTHYTITDTEGAYRLPLQKDSTYTISIRYLGYQTRSYTLKATADQRKDFQLSEVANALETVELSVQLPIVVKGDTTRYRAASFATGEERKLKDLLAKLPNLEVTPEGTVLVQGKKVTNLLIEGKRFFDGGTKLGVDHIPSDAIEKVEIIENYNEVSFLKAASQAQQIAMNLVLKKEKKRFAFGDLSASKGEEPFYQLHANVFYYSPKVRVNSILNSNTIGTQTFTFKEYLAFQGGVNAIFDAGFDWNAQEFAALIEPSQHQKSKQHFSALHYTQELSAKTELSSYLLNSYHKQHTLEEILLQYPTYAENRSQQGTTRQYWNLGKIRLNHRPNDTNEWSWQSSFKATNSQAAQRLYTQTPFIDNTLRTEQDLPLTTADTQLQWHRSMSQQNISALLSYRYEHQNLQEQWDSNTPLLDSLLMQPM